MSLLTRTSILPNLSWWCIDCALDHIDAEITKLTIDIDNDTKQNAELLLEQSRAFIHQYLRIGSDLQPPAEALEKFCARVADLDAHSLFIINSILSEYAKTLILSRPVPLSLSVLELCASSLQCGLTELVINHNPIGDEFIRALAASCAAKTLQSIQLWYCFFTDRVSSLWRCFSAMQDITLDSCDNITLHTMEEMASLPSLMALSVDCAQLDALELFKIVTRSQRSLKILGIHVQAKYIELNGFNPILDLLRVWEGREMLEHFNLGWCEETKYPREIVEAIVDLLPNLISLNGNLDPVGRLLPQQVSCSSEAELNAEVSRASPKFVKLRVAKFFDFPSVLRLETSLQTFIFETVLGVGLGARNIDIIIDGVAKCQNLNVVFMTESSSLTKTHVEFLLASLPNLSCLMMRNVSKDAVTSGKIFVSHPNLREVPHIRVQGCNQVHPLWLPRMNKAQLLPNSIYPTYVATSPHVRELRVDNAALTDLASLPSETRESLRYYASTVHTMHVKDEFKSWLSFGRPWMIQRLELERGHWKQKTVDHILHSCPLLTRLKFFSYGRSTKLRISLDDMSWLVHPRLREVRLEECFVSRADCVLHIDLRTLPMLQKLWIVGIEGLNRFCVRAHPRLHSLKLEEVSHFSSFDVEIEDCPCLELVKISNIRLPIDAMSISNVPELRKLKLENVQLDAAMEKRSIKLQLPQNVNITCEGPSSEYVEQLTAL